MITPEHLKQMTTLGPYALSRLLAISGYTDASFESSEFVGINVDGDFVYKVSFHDESDTGVEVGKVFVKYNHTTQVVSADY
jgi:hypothetical protein